MALLGGPLQPLDVRRSVVSFRWMVSRLPMIDHQKIVEVMRNAARQVADGFHFLGLARALVSGAPFGQVPRDLCKAQCARHRCRKIALMTTLAQKRLPSLRSRQPSASYLPVSSAVRSADFGSSRLRSSGV